MSTEIEWFRNQKLFPPAIKNCVIKSEISRFVTGIIYVGFGNLRFDNTSSSFLSSVPPCLCGENSCLSCRRQIRLWRKKNAWNMLIQKRPGEKRPINALFFVTKVSQSGVNDP